MSDHKDSLPKVPQQIGDPINENLQKLAQLFPGVVKDGELDVEALREELGDFAEIQPGDEKYELSWAGKQAAKKKAFEPLLGKTLKYLPDDSKQPDTTENIYLEGDNLEGLKLIRPNYYGAISIIYIDPPYNTGNDFVYKDNFKIFAEESDLAEGVRSATGERLFKNESSSNRYHANWLDMMYPRLKLAKDLLREDGAVLISIDDHEIQNLKKIADEIFGEENFVAIFTWVKKKKGSHLSSTFRSMTEYVVCYSKNKARLNLIGEAAYSDKWQPLAKRTNSKKTLTFPENFLETTLPDGLYEKGNRGAGTSGIELLDEIRIKRGLVTSSCRISGPFVWTQEKLTTEIQSGSRVSLSKKFGLNSLRHDQANKVKRPSSLIDKKTGAGTNEDAYQEAIELFDKEGVMSYPKPSTLIKYLVRTATWFPEEDIILDFFSGSATTAHAVMQLNAEDGGKRKHIMVQLPEVCDPKSEAAKAGYTTIAEIGKERIRRAGDKIKAELVEKSKTATEEEKQANPYLTNPDALDIGFKCFRIEDTKINWLKKDLSGGELVDVDISDKDRLDFVPGFTDLDVVYEIMLRQSSIPLTEPICTLTDIGLRIYLYGESYLICLEEEITKEMVEKLAQLEPTPLKFIFRDSAFGKDIAFKDTTFRRLNAEIAKHTEGEETYTVEFI